jgi:hypothetical protein
MFFNRSRMDSDLREIKDLLFNVDKKLDLLIDRSESLAIMRLSEYSLREFLLDEPDLYSIDDVKSRFI